jgi:hypothetical protein
VPAVMKLGCSIARPTSGTFPSPQGEGLSAQNGLPRTLDGGGALDDFQVLAGGLVVVEMVEGDGNFQHLESDLDSCARPMCSSKFFDARLWRASRPRFAARSHGTTNIRQQSARGWFTSFGGWQSATLTRSSFWLGHIRS